MPKSESSVIEPPTPKNQRAARRALEMLRRAKRQKLALFEDAPDIASPLSKTAINLLIEYFSEIAEGHAVRLVPVDSELTTQQAAELLGVSRPHLVKMLEGKELPFRRVGKHRRVLLADVMAYKERQAAEREAVLDELTRQSQELGGYDKAGDLWK